MSTPLQIGITTDVGAIANFLDECVKAGLDIVQLFDSPQMIQARINAEVQARKDEIARNTDFALKTGDATKVNEDLS